jgi:hypothetical protein
VVAPPDVVTTGFGGEDVRTTGSPLSQKPSADVKATLARETGVLDIALVSRSGGSISRDAVCGLLNECLQDVTSAILVVSCLVVYYWASNVSCLRARLSD